jgi:hypothetical protein
MATKVTSVKIAKKASTVMTKKSVGKNTKSIAGSALSQVDPKKATSKSVAKKASAALRDGRTSTATKSVAGSALSQAGKKSSGTNSGGPRKK